jgi:hypothetical protein
VEKSTRNAAFPASAGERKIKCRDEEREEGMIDTLLHEKIAARLSATRPLSRSGSLTATSICAAGRRGAVWQGLHADAV